jgi:hypothetical protein
MVKKMPREEKVRLGSFSQLKRVVISEFSKSQGG